ncbi:MAG: dihydroneopterin aldolase [Muribaculum sp.]|nr:dihydroneopterin aldolase [Muribaculum sp.]
MNCIDKSFGRLTVSLVDARFHAKIGLFPQEQVVGNEFRVDMDIVYNPPCDLSDENFSNLISYVDLYDIVSQNMKKPRKLLETVANEIRSDLLHRFPDIISGNIRIEKLHPPISSLVGSCAITLSF